MGRQVETTKTTTVMTDTGEAITKTETTVTDTQFIPNDEPPYIKLYLKDILYLADLPESYVKVLYALIQLSSYMENPSAYGIVEEKGMLISISKGMKEMVCRQLGVKNIRTINNALTNLAKAKVLVRVATGTYLLNPNLFGKGYWKDIKKLRLKTEYDLNKRGRTFKADIEYRDRIEINVTPEPEQLNEGHKKTSGNEKKEGDKK